LGVVFDDVKVGEHPGSFGVGGTFGENVPARIVGPIPDDAGPKHVAGEKIVGFDEPPTTFGSVVEGEVILRLTLGVAWLAGLMTGEDVIGGLQALGDPEFVDGKDTAAEEKPDGEIGEGEAKDADAGGADGGDLVMAGVVGQGIKQGEEEGDGEDGDEISGVLMTYKEKTSEAVSLSF